MSRRERKLALAVLVFIMSCSIFLIIKIKISDNQNKEINNEIYEEYKDFVADDNQEETEDADEDTDENGSEGDSDVFVTVDAQGKKYRIAGEINIPKIAVNYPVIYETTDANLKIAPTKLSGPNINEPGNVCIVGHNYKSKEFFSRLSELTNGDKVNLTNNNGKRVTYIVCKKYEVPETDLSPIEPNYSDEMELTLITCTKRKSDRLVVKCKAEDDI